MPKVLIINTKSDLSLSLDILIKNSVPDITVLKRNSEELLLEDVAAVNPDLVIIDTVRSFLSGINISARLKKDQTLFLIPVIVLLDESHESDPPEMYIKSAADLFIYRPFKDEELISAIKTLLRIKLLETNVSSESKRFEELLSRSTRDLHKKLEEKYITEQKLQKSNYELEMSKLATLNLLEDIMTEIDQRKEVEKLNNVRSEELRISEEKFKNIFEKAPVGKSLTMLDGTIRPNKAFSDLLGYSIEELCVMNWRDFTYPEDISKNEEFLSLLNNGVLTTARWDKRFVHKNGDIVWVDISTTLMRDQIGSPLYYITTVIDITEKKRVEEEVFLLNTKLEKRVTERTAQLQEANKELEAFSYSVSHDLRAPLRAIDGFSKYVQEEYDVKLDAEGKRLLSLIRNNTKKMDKLITDILSLSRVSRTEQKKSRVDMKKMAVSMYHECTDETQRKKIDLKSNPMPDSLCDPTYLKLVWTNLLSNAIKFTTGKENPEIIIGGYRDNEFNIYYVKDNGVGFNQDYAFKIFGVFQRLHNSEHFEGTGVGLAIVQRIIHRHDGKVWALGKVDEGATIYFSLPVLED